MHKKDSATTHFVVSYCGYNDQKETSKIVSSYQEAVEVADKAKADIFVVEEKESDERGGKTIDARRGFFGEVCFVKDLNLNEPTPDARWMKMLLFHTQDTYIEVIKLRSGAILPLVNFVSDSEDADFNIHSVTGTLTKKVINSMVTGPERFDIEIDGRRWAKYEL